MYRKQKLLLIVILFIVCLIPLQHVEAMKIEQYQTDNTHILIVYSGTDSGSHPRLQELDMVFHHFTESVQIKHFDHVSAADMQGKTHLFYVGFQQEQLDKEQVHLIEGFPNKMILIGENKSQFSTFSIVEEDTLIPITSLSNIEQGTYIDTRYLNQIKLLHAKKAHQVLLYGKNNGQTYPIIVKLNSKRYVMQMNMATNEMNRVFRNYFIEVLHDIIPNNHAEKQLASIHLEAINPLSDATSLLEIGEFLNEKQIPYQLIVTPVYYDKMTGETYYLSENSRLLEVLHLLQDGYGSIVVHGYQHEYYLDDDAQGVEFWDSKYNQMIINESYLFAEQMKGRHDFTNDLAYEQYISELQATEEAYVHSRLQHAIYEFAIADLNPVAFQPPSYSMSLNGYRLLSQYFDAIVGRVQMGDDMALITNSPVITSANYLYGMTYYPETIGYYNPNNPLTIGDMKRKINEISVIRDGVFSSSFHPYLGVEEFKRYFAVYEALPNVEWIDWKQERLTVETEHAKWYIDENDRLGTYMNKQAIESIIRADGNDVTEYILWSITIVVSLFVLLFLAITLYLRLTVRKKLFNERRK